MPDQDLAALATEAFFYGYPLAADVGEVIRFTQSGMGGVPAAPFNQFSHARALAGPADTFVTINNDTLYSMAQLDLSAGPVEMEVPDTGDRYHVLQFIDAWTNNFAYAGTRADGSAKRSYLVTPPGWSRDIPDGVTQIPAPTQVVSILGRWACSGPADLPAVHALQDQLTLRPACTGAAGAGVPGPASGVPEDLQFLEKLRTWMRAFPPAPPDQSYQQRFAPLGLLDQVSPYLDRPADVSAALAAGLAAGKTSSKPSPALAPSRRSTAGWSACTCSTTTSTTSGRGRSTPRSGRKPAGRRPTPSARSRPGHAADRHRGPGGRGGRGRGHPPGPPGRPATRAPGDRRRVTRPAGR